MSNLAKLVKLPSISDERGALVALEANDSIPFDVKRVYYMVLDDGRNRESVWLDSPEKGLLINELIWREMYDFSPDCVLLVLASEHYDESDYVRDYEDFRELVDE